MRVLLADDHDIVRSGVRDVLQQHGVEVVAEAEDGEAAVRLEAQTTPDVAVLDMSMPKMNGIETARASLSRNPSARIVILSMHRGAQMVWKAFAAGAAAYLPKNSPPQELLLAIRAVHEGELYLGAGVMSSVLSGILASPTRQESVFTLLNRKQREILQLLAEGKSNKEVAQYVDISVKGVEKQRTLIMKKLNIYTLAELTKYAVREGLTSVDE
jgi:DNA-binding NarL/FixJ family response regulator